MSSTPGEPTDTDTNFHRYSPPNTFFDDFEPYDSDEPGWFDNHWHTDIGESEVEIIDSPAPVKNQEESDEGVDAFKKDGSDIEVTEVDTRCKLNRSLYIGIPQSHSHLIITANSASHFTIRLPTLSSLRERGGDDELDGVSNDEQITSSPAASMASRTASLRWVEQLSRIMILRCPG
jgi:hypothetical protein